jgi:hypothetical protein
MAPVCVNGSLERRDDSSNRGGFSKLYLRHSHRVSGQLNLGCPSNVLYDSRAREHFPEAQVSAGVGIPSRDVVLVSTPILVGLVFGVSTDCFADDVD